MLPSHSTASDGSSDEDSSSGDEGGGAAVAAGKRAIHLHTARTLGEPRRRKHLPVEFSHSMSGEALTI